jgi:uncharacterized protein (TIGR00369 family)
MASQIQLVDDHYCFACGRENPIGLKLNFEYPRQGECRAGFVPLREHQGWQGVLHGGIIATLLDEALAHALGGPDRGRGSGAVTAEITVSFKKPVPIETRVILSGRVNRQRGRLIEAVSQIENEQGEVLASAMGKLVIPKSRIEPGVG